MKGDKRMIKNIVNIPHLNDKEKEAIQAFVEKIQLVYNISNIILFGSKARGDYHQYSDIDLLIIVSGKFDMNDRWYTSELAADISLDYEVALNCVYYFEGDWKNKESETVNPLLKKNVLKDGVSIVFQ